MELQYLYFLLFPFLLLILVELIRTRNSKLKLPPGPRQLPIIGSLHHLLRSGLPHHALGDLAKTYGPLMHLKLGEVSTIVVTSGDVAKEILKTHDLNFSSRADNFAVKIMLYNGADMVFSPYGDFWRQLRKLFVTELMSAKRVQSFQWIRDDEALDFMRTIDDSRSSPVNLSELLHSFTNNLTARVAFGNKCRDAETFSRELKASVELASGFMAADLYPSWASIIGFVTGMKSKLERCHQNVDRVLQNIIQEHIDRRAIELKDGVAEIREENFLDVLFKLQAKSGPGFQLTGTNIKAIIFDVFGAGSGTSASSMTWTVSELMRNPRVLKLVIKESLRLHPPAPLLVPRENSDKCEIQGFDVPFGGGRRMCPGILFGLATMEVALAHLLCYFDWSLPDGMSELDMTEAKGMGARRKFDLKLCASPVVSLPMI